MLQTPSRISVAARASSARDQVSPSLQYSPSFPASAPTQLYYPASDLLGQGLWAARMGAAMLGLFGLLALAFASIGIYGVLTFSVAQRTADARSSA